MRKHFVVYHFLVPICVGGRGERNEPTAAAERFVKNKT